MINTDLTEVRKGIWKTEVTELNVKFFEDC